MPGQVLGDRYEIEKQLGRTSGRWTLLARDLTTEQPVILKVLCLDDELRPDDLKLFQREVDTLQTLAHPATPKYLGYFEMDLPKSGKALALIQSYIEGTSLQQYLDQGRRLTPAEAYKIARSILEILVYLHDRQPPIVHRDIKPGNILLSSSEEAIADRVCLIDFGSVKSFAVTESHTTLSLVGTNGYMPPEQLGRRAVIASDLYSLGITLVTAISGMSPDQLPRQGMQVQVAQVVRAQPQFVNWLQQMTEPELAQRFKTAEAALAVLETMPQD